MVRTVRKQARRLTRASRVLPESRRVAGATKRPLHALETTRRFPTPTIQSAGTRRDLSSSGKRQDTHDCFCSPTLRRAWPPRRGPRGRHMRSRCRCSMCSAIHINSRSWLRSSSTHEPSDPPLKVITLILFLHSQALSKACSFDNQIEFCEEGKENAKVCGRRRAGAL